MLNALLDNDANPHEVKMYYNAAVKFTNMLDEFIANGERKKSRISKLADELKNKRESD